MTYKGIARLIAYPVTAEFDFLVDANGAELLALHDFDACCASLANCLNHWLEQPNDFVNSDVDEYLYVAATKRIAHNVNPDITLHILADSYKCKRTDEQFVDIQTMLGNLFAYLLSSC